MKKFLFLSTLTILLTGFYLETYPQITVFSSGFENWTGNIPTGWMGTKTTLNADSVSPYTSGVYSGNFAVRLRNGSSTHKRFTSQPVSVITGTTYTITFWVRGHGNIRTGLYDGRASGSGYATYNTYINVYSSDWTQQVQTITAANTTPLAEFILSVQSTYSDLEQLQVDELTITSNVPLPPSIALSITALYILARVSSPFLSRDLMSVSPEQVSMVMFRV
ncbi:MAG: carbohydrate binding domain-containing protein [Bacteroidetes bacterium]|nr:carbohydrate binding domain-containing protein [Bacteroidota bacterium]